MTENLTDNAGQTSDTRLIARAVKQRWPISDTMRAAIVNRMGRIVANHDGDGPAPSRREVIAASKCIIEADKLNLEQEKRDNPTPVEHHHSGSVAIVIVEDEKWYGNEAHVIAAQSTATPIAGALGRSEVQSNGVRPTLGKNGAQSNGHH